MAGSRCTRAGWAARGLSALLAVLIAMTLVVAAGCAANTTTSSPEATSAAPPGATGTSETISGIATFSGGPLPDDAVLLVRLVDNSDPDSATATLGETTVTASGASQPIDFSVPYDLSRVDPSHLYAVKAEITSGGRTILATKGNTLVITEGRPTAGIALPLKEP